MRAEITEVDVALAHMRHCETAACRDELSGSSIWCRAAATSGAAGELVPILFLADDDPIGATILARVRADWRSGSPGSTCLQWPMQAFGYHFAPRWMPGQSGDGWTEALVARFPRERIDLRRSAAVGADAGAGRGPFDLAPGPATWRLDVDGDLAAWRNGLRGSHRRDLDYYRRRIERAGGSWIELGPKESPATGLADCFDLHRERVAAKGQASTYLSDAGRSFLAALATTYRSALRLSRLQIGGALAASCLTFVHRGHLQCFMPGFTAHPKGLDLGRQGIYHQVLQEFDRGLATIDLLGGDLPYKREFGLRPQTTADLCHRPTRLAAVREELVTGARRVYRRMSRS